MKVVIVGGAGYIGTVLTKKLLDMSMQVRVIDRFFFGNFLPDHPALHTLNMDMTQIEPGHFETYDVVVMLGGLSNDPTAEWNPEANRNLNHTTPVSLANLAKKLGVPRFIYASTCSVYDRGLGEDEDRSFDEDAEVAPTAPYAMSKLAAERELVPLADSTFAPIIFRKGTVYGFSPRMRYDLVVNTFVADAMSKGSISLDRHGEMWRPLLNIHEAVASYVHAIVAPDVRPLSGQVFNLVSKNFRVSELALRTQRVLKDYGIECNITFSDDPWRKFRSYRASAEKFDKVFGNHVVKRDDLRPAIADMINSIQVFGYTDFSNPRYYNIHWMRLLEEVLQRNHKFGYIFRRA